jgi:hypothetical protein
MIGGLLNRMAGHGSRSAWQYPRGDMQDDRMILRLPHNGYTSNLY